MDMDSLDIFSPELRANPYRYYQELIERSPVTVKLDVPTVAIAKHSQCAAVLRDYRRFSSKRILFDSSDSFDPYGGALTMLFSDPPDHFRLRGLVSRAFTPNRIANMSDRIREMVDRLLDEVMAKEQFDVMSDLADPLPLMVIADLIGAPIKDHVLFRDWMKHIWSADNVPPDQPLPEGATRASKDIRGYFQDLIEARRKHPGEDLVSALVLAHSDEEKLTDGELLALVMLLVMAGDINFIGNGLLALCRHEDQLQRIREESSLLPSAVEEILRYDNPVQGIIRMARIEVELGGRRVEPGQFVLVLVGAANRDNSVFPEPNRFDITRSPNPHLGFGVGIHVCLGEPLARLEGSIAIESVIKRFRDLELAVPERELNYAGSLFMRRLARLPLKFRR